ncbi:MAG: single-stranded-DNA-specific exonuclease RecJ [Eubacterium sp.]|nr:single-stranded-DNA-specific exonuclease RecJ [Eubacterium sp.]
MDADWRIYSKRADFNAIANRFNIDPVVARVIRNRDVESEEEIERFLYGTLDDCHDGNLMKDMDKGVSIISEKIDAGESIRIVGDYDVDGVTSTYILYDAIRCLGGKVSYDIPHRITDGYGINVRIIEQAASDEVDTIITCDNGIAAFDAVTRAKELGLTIVVTDHHEIQEMIPDADAVIDPHQEGDAYPYKAICGAEVAYKFIRCLYKYRGQELEDRKYIDFVALATYCDVMPLLDENRIYVREGMKKIAETDNLGLAALVRQCSLEGASITGYHLGFVLGPCINTAGRIGSAKEALLLFLEEDEAACASKALALKIGNDDRKRITEEGTALAIETVLREGYDKDQVIVLYLNGVHESLAGIIAGKIKEHFYRPTIVFTDSENEELLKGSGRSIEDYNLFEKLSEVKDILYKFGGHKLAAGLTIQRDELDKLREELNNRADLNEQQLTPKLMIDVPMPLRYVNMGLIAQLDSLEPFGTANPRPLFAEAGLKVNGLYIYGKRGNVMNISVTDSRGGRFMVMTFDPEGVIEDIKKWFTEEVCDKMLKGAYTGVMLDIAYQPQINEYRGERNIQFLLKNMRPHTA